jgi:hypothetical protein
MSREYRLDCSLAKETAARLDPFTRGYIEAAMWTLTDTRYECEDCEHSSRDCAEAECEDCGGRMRERTESCDHLGLHDIAEETIAKAIEECAAFQEAHRADLELATEERGRDDAYHGHDFWLTRNGHGVGFWDRGYSPKLSKRLTDAAHAWGSCDWYIGDDGMVYQAG